VKQEKFWKFSPNVRDKLETPRCGPKSNQDLSTLQHFLSPAGTPLSRFSHSARSNGALRVRIQPNKTRQSLFYIPNLLNEAFPHMIFLTKSLRSPLARAAVLVAISHLSVAQGTSPKTDILILSNGDTLHGKFVNEVAGKVTFHTDSLGDLIVSWDKITELHAAEKFALLDKNVKRGRKRHAAQVPTGPVDMADAAVTVRGANAPTTVPVKDAQYIVDESTFDKQLNREPSFFTGWNGAATGGATLVEATQNQYTVSGALGLVRVVPTVSWLNPFNRTSADFSGSYGKITQPAYILAGSLVAPSVTKSAIFHFDAERDEYVSSRFFLLAQTAFDHNFAQDLQLQQIYGGGLGWTVLSTPRHQADLKATMQYEKQQFITGSSGTTQDLVGSTFSADYLLKLRLFSYAQGLQFIPAYNIPRAYSANETNTVAFPAYKSLAFSFGTIDSYLNDPPTSVPPTKRNSFQFTMGLNYAIKSKY